MQTAFKEKYTSAGFFTEYNRRGEQVKVEYFYVSWLPLGPCRDMADAKAKYGGYPVLGGAR